MLEKVLPFMCVQDLVVTFMRMMQDSVGSPLTLANHMKQILFMPNIRIARFHWIEDHVFSSKDVVFTIIIYLYHPTYIIYILMSTKDG